MKPLHEVNNVPSLLKIVNCNESKNIYYRFQDRDLEIGTQSWGMMYSTPEEALEDGETILNGKSCCTTAKELKNYSSYFNKDSVVLIVKGWFVETGHDGEDVVDIEKIVEIWSYEDFMKVSGEFTYFMDELIEENGKLWAENNIKDELLKIDIVAA